MYLEMSAAVIGQSDGTFIAEFTFTFDGKTRTERQQCVSAADAAHQIHIWAGQSLRGILRIEDDKAVEDKLAPSRTETPPAVRGVAGAKRANNQGDLGRE